MLQNLAGVFAALSTPERLGDLLSDRRSLVYAILVHIAFAVVFLVSFSWTSAPEPTEPVNVVQATVVDESKVQAELDKLKQAEAKKKNEELARQKALDKKAREAELARRKEEKRLAELKKQKEAEARKIAEQKKQQEEQARKLAEQKKAEAARQAELEKQRQEEAAAQQKQREEQQRLEAERALQEQLAAEQKQRAEEQERKAKAEREAKAQKEVARYVDIIKQKVTRNWLKPQGADTGLKCQVHVTLIPGGDVVSVKIATSSGDPRFDNSVELAVRKASPLPIPSDPAMFDRFRELTFIFNPEE